MPKTPSKRTRRFFSVKEELLKKSREAALAAVQVFNNPNVTFKSERYIVLMIIAWTYLLHAWCRSERVDYAVPGLPEVVRRVERRAPSQNPEVLWEQPKD